MELHFCGKPDVLVDQGRSVVAGLMFVGTLPTLLLVTEFTVVSHFENLVAHHYRKSHRLVVGWPAPKILS